MKGAVYETTDKRRPTLRLRVLSEPGPLVPLVRVEHSRKTEKGWSRYKERDWPANMIASHRLNPHGGYRLVRRGK